MTMRKGVIIAANNEESTIGRCLSGLLLGAEPGELEIIVVCNGCVDSTAAKAAALSRAVTVLETPVANKAAALEIGCGASTVFPRFFIDADVTITCQDIREVSRALNTREPRAAAPRMQVDLENRPLLVRWYFDVWTRLPYATRRLVGSGVYAVNRAGWDRIGTFPVQGCDDTWIAGQFAEHERISVADASFRIPAPHSVRELVRQRGRTRANEIFEREAIAMLNHVSRNSALSVIGLALRSPRMIPRIVAYVAIRLIAEGRARWKVVGNRRAWERNARHPVLAARGDRQ